MSRWMPQYLTDDYVLCFVTLYGVTFMSRWPKRYIFMDYTLVGADEMVCSDPDACAMAAKRPRNGEKCVCDSA